MLVIYSKENDKNLHKIVNIIYIIMLENGIKSEWDHQGTIELRYPLKRDHVVFKITRVLWKLANLLRINFKIQKKHGNRGKIVVSQELASVSSFAIFYFVCAHKDEKVHVGALQWSVFTCVFIGVKARKQLQVSFFRSCKTHFFQSLARIHWVA